MNDKFIVNKKIKLLILLITFFASFLPLNAGSYECDIAIPVEVFIKGGESLSGVKSTVEISSIDGPLPSETTLEFTDSETLNFGVIKYTTPNDYTYTIKQIPGSMANMTYDETVYTVIVRVVNEGSSLSVAVVVIKNDTGEKYDSIKFTNVYSKPKPPTPSNPPKDPETPKWTCEDEGKVWDEEKQACVYGRSVVNTSTTQTPLLWILLIATSLIVLFYLRKKTK